MTCVFRGLKHLTEDESSLLLVTLYLGKSMLDPAKDIILISGIERLIDKIFPLLEE